LSISSSYPQSKAKTLALFYAFWQALLKKKSPTGECIARGGPFRVKLAFFFYAFFFYKSFALKKEGIKKKLGQTT
jgi:hypothetical protein